jgi:hypothetical protein
VKRPQFARRVEFFSYPAPHHVFPRVSRRRDERISRSLPWREAAGLYQREAAQIAAVSVSAWRNYECRRWPVPQWLWTVLMVRHPIRRSAMRARL